MKVRCIRLRDQSNTSQVRSSWLKIGQTYHVLAIEITPGCTMLRLIGEEPVPALFEPELFEVVTSAIPSIWVVSSAKPGYVVIGPALFASPGFLERYYDRNPDAVAGFDEECKKIRSGEP